MTGPDDDGTPPPASKGADLITGLVLVGTGAWFYQLSSVLPRPASWGITSYSAPGLVPGILGIVLAVLGLMLCWRSRRSLIESAVWRGLAGAILSLETVRALIALGLTLVYPLVLLGWLPFWVATAIFLFLFIFLFEALAEDRPTGWARLVLMAGVQALCVAGMVFYVFQELMLVRLP